MSIRKEQKEGSSITYYINEEKRTVVAKMPLSTVANDIDNNCLKKGLKFIPAYREIKKYPHKNIIGIAKCAPEDTFDIETGKRIAAARLLQKYYKIKLNAYRVIADFYDNKLSTCEDLMNYSWLSYNKFVKKEKTTAYSGKNND